MRESKWTKRFRSACGRLRKAFDALRGRMSSHDLGMQDVFATPTGTLKVEAWTSPTFPVTRADCEAYRKLGYKAETVVFDPNRVVLLGRKAMSRLIVGNTATDPTDPVTLEIFGNFKDIDALYAQNPCRITVTGHGIPWFDPSTTPDPDKPRIRLASIQQAEWLAMSNQVIRVEEVLGPNDLSINWDSSGYTTAYDPVTDPGVCGFLSEDDVKNHPEYFYIRKMKFGVGGVDPSDPTTPLDTGQNDEGLTWPVPSLTKTADIDFPDERSVRFIAGLATHEGNGYALSEEGLFTDSDYMFARKTYATLNKSVHISLRYEHTILF